MNVRINKEKSIGKVLYIVEGNKTEALILYYIFCKIYDYQFESILRGKGYHKYNSKEILPIKDNILDSKSFISIKIDIIIIENMIIDIV